jgi:hypothetical protein
MGGGSGNPLASQTTGLHPSTPELPSRTKPMATMAAFLKSSFLSILHKLLMGKYLHKIFTCYKMAMWPFFFNLKRIESKRSPAVFAIIYDRNDKLNSDRSGWPFSRHFGTSNNSTQKEF